MPSPSSPDAAPSPLTQLTEEERMFQDQVRRFARERAAPHVREMDEAGKLRPELVTELFEMGLMAIDVAEEFEGQGGSFFQSVLAIEELAKVDPSVSLLVDVQNTLFNNAVTKWGTEDQKRTWLPRVATDAVASYALSEAGSGSDAFALQTRATKIDGGFRLTGRKLWITNALEATFFLVFATIDPEAGYKGITAYVIEKDADGFRVGKKEDKLGIRASSTCELILEDCFLPDSSILGEVGKGYKVAIETLNQGRIGIGAQMVGLAQGALDHAVSYAKQRKQFGAPIATFQGVQFDLAEMAVEIEAARLLVYNAARLCDAGKPHVQQAAMAKYFASQIAERCASRAVEIFGGIGFTKDSPVEKLYRDAKIGRIYEGTSNMQRLVIAKGLLL